LLCLRGHRSRAHARRRRSRRLGGTGARAVHRDLSRDRRPGAAAARRRRDRAPARRVRAREGGVRAPLRARQPPGLGWNPGRGYRAAHAAGCRSAVTVDLGANPHGVLGAHQSEDGVVVRTIRPEAQAVRVQPAGVEAKLKDPAGLWEAPLPKAPLPLEYELEVEYPDGNTFTVRDPYSFLPTLGELDLHLAMEGRHEHLYERLGAHVRELDGVVGTAFAVWAPNARSVSVVGDFNSWDGRLNPMRSLGSSRIWELFVPGVDAGTKYKFEIRTQEGRLRLKSDPLAFHTEVPPANASVVWDDKHVWRDEEWLARRAAADPLHGPMSVYEVHLGSWRRNPLEDNRPLSYHELADELA